MAKSVFRRFPSQDLAEWADDNTWDLGDDGLPFFKQQKGNQVQEIAEDFFEAAGGSTQALSGASAGVSAVTGALQVRRGLAGAAAGAAGLTATLGVRRGLSGSTAGASTVGGAIAVRRGLWGYAQGQATISGAISVVVRFSGAVAAEATVTGALTVHGIQALSGSVEAVSTVSGSLTVIPAEPERVIIPARLVTGQGAGNERVQQPAAPRMYPLPGTRPFKARPPRGGWKRPLGRGTFKGIG